MPGPDDDAYGVHVTPHSTFKDEPGTRTVNIDEWLNRRVSESKRALMDVERRVKLPVTPEEREKAAQAQRELLERWERQKAERERDDKLESGARECSGCANMERHYIGDYICFRCRDELES